MLPRHLIRDIVERQLKAVDAAPTRVAAAPATPAALRLCLGSDHGGYDMKEVLKKHLAEQGHAVEDVGTHDGQAVDYPDIAAQVARAVKDGRAQRGIVVDGVGIGSCMAANKIPGIRAAHCTHAFEARNSREHNDAHVLCLGGRTLGTELAKQIVDIFLSTPFGGGRHAARVAKIEALEHHCAHGPGAPCHS